MSANVQVELRVDMTADIVDDKKETGTARTKAEAHLVHGIDDAGVDNVDTAVVVQHPLAGAVLRMLPCCKYCGVHAEQLRANRSGCKQ